VYFTLRKPISHVQVIIQGSIPFPKQCPISCCRDSPRSPSLHEKFFIPSTHRYRYLISVPIDSIKINLLTDRFSIRCKDFFFPLRSIMNTSSSFCVFLLNNIHTIAIPPFQYLGLPTGQRGAVSSLLLSSLTVRSTPFFTTDIIPESLPRG
jgi:hypothetical protein